mmetsp:Transcript_76965/g.221018  ORF Transcript_76965/g.221018 Transcript_76965/m.221018 type:complete len:274 (+) Transcript_76965:1815-2636(+)
MSICASAVVACAILKNFISTALLELAARTHMLATWCSTSSRLNDATRSRSSCSDAKSTPATMSSYWAIQIPFTKREPRCFSASNSMPCGVATASSLAKPWSVRKRNLGVMDSHSTAVIPSTMHTLSVGAISPGRSPRAQKPLPSASAASVAAARGRAWTPSTCISYDLSCTSSKLHLSSPVSIDTANPLRNRARAPTFMPSPNWPTAWRCLAFLLKPSRSACREMVMPRFTMMSRLDAASCSTQPSSVPASECATVATKPAWPSPSLLGGSAA